MTNEDAIKILQYKVNMYDTDIYIGDLDKTNIEAIKTLLNYNKELQEYKENATRKYWQEKCAEHHIKEKLLEAKIERVIDLLKYSASNKGMSTQPETDTIQSALMILEGDDKYV